MYYQDFNRISGLESAGFDSGRILAAESGSAGAVGVNYTPYYQLTDHLGSVRTVFTLSEGRMRIVAQNDYYAFGLRHATDVLSHGSSTDNRYLFNGKEDQVLGRLGLLDYGARMYDPQTGRWFNMDPLAEKYSGISPYAYCGNNPVCRIDPNGLEWETDKDKEHAEKLVDTSNQTISRLSEEKNKKQEKKDKIANNKKLSSAKKEKKLAFIAHDISEIDAKISLTNNFINGLDLIAKDQTKYTFNISPGSFTYQLGSRDDGTIVINSDGSLGNMVHETTHAIQHARGEVSLTTPGSTRFTFKGYSQEAAEVRAYATQYAISGIVPSSSRGGTPNGLVNITPYWVSGIMGANNEPVYGNLYDKYEYR